MTVVSLLMSPETGWVALGLFVAGLYGFALNLPATDLWRMLTDVATEYGHTLRYSPVAALGIALLIGLAIARAPEYLWRRDGGTR